MAKPVVKFKTYRQTQRVGGKIYGVANLADPQIASVTMQEVIDYAKLHNYSAATLEALLSQVISGVADLVARDGRPRNLSDLLKFEPVIKGTFQNMEQTVSRAQKIVIRPRLLKEIRVNIASDAFSWQNQNDTESPKIVSVAPASDTYSAITLQMFTDYLTAPSHGFSYAGQRLCPNGWDSNCSFDVIYKPVNTLVQGITDYHFVRRTVGAGDLAGFMFRGDGDEATDNVFAVSSSNTGEGAAPVLPCWYEDSTGTPTGYTGGTIVPAAGDMLVFQFSRVSSLGEKFTAEKTYTL